MYIAAAFCTDCKACSENLKTLYYYISQKLRNLLKKLNSLKEQKLIWSGLQLGRTPIGN